jgi:hypothetical protein
MHLLFRGVRTTVKPSEKRAGSTGVSLRTSRAKVVFNFGFGATLKENKPGSRGGGRLKTTGHDHANRTAPYNFGPVTLRTD